MLNFFKQSYLAQQITIVAMALVLWLPTFITKSAIVVGESTTPLYNLIISLFEFSPLLIEIIVFAVFVVCIFLFNSVLSANRLVSKTSTLPALSFLLMMCATNDLPYSFQFIMACPFILMAMHTLFLIFQTDNPENYMMNIGYFIAIASLFYYPSAFLMIWVLVSFPILKFNEIRYLLIPILGFMVINVIFLGMSFLLGNINELLDSYHLFFSKLGFTFDFKNGNMIIFLISGVLCFVSLLRILSDRSSDKGVNIRKRVGVALVLTFISLILFFIDEPTMCNTMIFMMFAFFYAIVLSDVKKTRIVNIVMYLMSILIFANQYLPLFGITI